MTPNANDTATANDRQVMVIDNLLRRELKVGDPRDPQQIARALADRYQGDSRAQAISGEAQGLPFLRTDIARSAAPAAPVATNLDLEQARQDVAQDLGMLIADNLAKDIRPELEGWQAVIHRSIDEGVAAARYGLDPHQRDKAFAMRRQLGDYARLARMVGVLTPDLNRSFRNLAQSIDEACAVILVLMGESMANLGLSGGRYLLQAPYSELQARRDAVLNALRQLDGVSALSMQPNTWPRGLRAYRQLRTMLESKGQGDLRSLMNEAELARTMDEIVGLASGGASSGLRALGATAWAPVARLNRFVQSTLRPVSPASPELLTLLEALQLFIDGFVPAGGFRLLRVARPAVLNYGLYGPTKISKAETRLINLTNSRGNLARLLDCLGECECDRNMSLARIVLDGVLYHLDRAIDFYCVGNEEFGLPEARAATLSFVIDTIEPSSWNRPGQQGWHWYNPVTAQWASIARRPFLDKITGALNGDVMTELRAISRLLRPAAHGAGTQAIWDLSHAKFEDDIKMNRPWLGSHEMEFLLATVMHDELCLQRATELEWRTVIEQMTDGCIEVDAIFRDTTPDYATPSESGALPLVLDRALDIISTLTMRDPNKPAERAVLSIGEFEDPVLPPNFEESLARISNAF